MFAEPAHQECSAKLRSALGGDCSRRAVSLSYEVEFQMAPNLREPHQQDFCRVSGGNSLPNNGILLDRAGIAKVRKIWTLVIVLIVA
jgi:hypothetical protein